MWPMITGHIDLISHIGHINLIDHISHIGHINLIDHIGHINLIDHIGHINLIGHIKTLASKYAPLWCTLFYTSRKPLFLTTFSQTKI